MDSWLPHIIYIVGLENVDHLLQRTCNLSRTLAISPVLAALESSAVSSLGLHPFQRSSPETFIFYSLWLG